MSAPQASDLDAKLPVPDLSALLKGEVAYGAMTAIFRDLRAQQTNGKRIPGWAKPVLQALAYAANEPVPPALLALVGRPIARVESINWVSSRDAAAHVGRSQRQVRRLAADGHVRANRVTARAWLIDLDSLTNVLRNNNDNR